MCDLPLVSIICTVYNHQRYVSEALASVFSQTYSRIELIIIDNCSDDDSVVEIEKSIAGRSGISFIKNKQNIGLCRAFNQGLALSSGDYIIDLSADDILLPSRVEKQVILFSRLTDDYAVVFTNAEIIDVEGRRLASHYKVDSTGRALRRPPDGEVYQDILKRYFICTPTMMMRRTVMDELGGYDEHLIFEDFDFWVRSSVNYRYAYLDELLTCKRVVDGSLSGEVVKKDSGLLVSTLVICRKAMELNRCLLEDKLLADRTRTFIRKCWYAEEFELAFRFESLLKSLDVVDVKTQLVLQLCRCGIPVNKLYRFYLNYFYKKKVKIKRVGFWIN